MRAVLFLLMLGPAGALGAEGCVVGHDEPIVSPNPSGADYVRLESPVPATVRHVPACEQLIPTVGECCVLACSDPELFRETCGRPGQCVDYACPLMDGSFLTPGVCEP